MTREKLRDLGWWVALGLEICCVQESQVAPALTAVRALASVFGGVSLGLRVGVDP